MKLSQFSFDLPKELIAKYPVENRDESRLLVFHKEDGKIEHKLFKDIIDYFDDQDLFILNDTRVFPAKLKGIKEKTGAKIEVLLLRELNRRQKLWDTLVNPARKIRIGNKLYFGENDQTLVAEVIDNTTSRGRIIRFLFDGEPEDLKNKLKKMGEPPIPTFLGREAEPEDLERYQTIYAEKEGAVAAPTAGMHFSKILLKKFEIKGIQTTSVTLHVGLGNFRAISVEDLSKHKVDSEEIYISEQTANIVNETQARERKICAVGTTVMRTIETATSVSGELKPFKGWTSKFIYPPYKFKIPTAMVTNLHLPQSLPMMTAVAFGGYRPMMKAYDTAVKEKYKFGTYGDAMLIL